MTIGSFSVFDSDLQNGTGCSQISITNNSATQNANYYYYDGAHTNEFSLSAGTTSTNIVEYNGVDAYPESVYLLDGSSMITTMAANSAGYATPLASGNIPCINIGGMAGT